MGITWDISDLVGINDKEEDGEAEAPSQLPRHIRIPLAMSAAPEFYRALAAEYKKKYQAAFEAKRMAQGSKVTEVGNLSTSDARRLFQMIAPMLSNAKPKDE